MHWQAGVYWYGVLYVVYCVLYIVVLCCIWYVVLSLCYYNIWQNGIRLCFSTWQDFVFLYSTFELHIVWCMFLYFVLYCIFFLELMMSLPGLRRACSNTTNNRRLAPWEKTKRDAARCLVVPRPLEHRHSDNVPGNGPLLLGMHGVEEHWAY